MLEAVRSLGQILDILKSIDARLGKIIENQEREIRLLRSIRKRSG